MPLNALTLSTTQGVQGRRFRAVISGLTPGSSLEVLSDGSPGFSTVNDKLDSSSLPYPVSTAVLRETKAGETPRETRIDITAATREQLLASAQAQVGVGRTLVGYRVAGLLQNDGTTAYSVVAVDDLGATTSSAVGVSASFAPGGEPVITTLNPVAGQPMDISFTALNATEALVELFDVSNPSVTLASVTVPL